MLNMEMVKVHIENSFEEMFDELDTWYGLIEYGTDFAVDYNYYIDEGEQNSSFYFCTKQNGDEYPTVNTEISKPYNVDREDPDWLSKLIKEAVIFLEECLKEEV